MITTESMKREIWDRWINANELEKQKIISELPLFNVKCPLFSATLINSYFEDFFLHIIEKYNIDFNEE